MAYKDRAIKTHSARASASQIRTSVPTCSLMICEKSRSMRFMSARREKPTLPVWDRGSNGQCCDFCI